MPERQLMPITTRRNPDRDLTIFDCEGDLSFVEIAEVMKRFVRGTIALPTKNILCDLRYGSIASLTIDQINHIVGLLDDYMGEAKGTKIALVVSQGINFDIVRSLEPKEREPLEALTIFRKIDEATDWFEKGSE